MTMVNVRLSVLDTCVPVTRVSLELTVRWTRSSVSTDDVQGMGDASGSTKHRLNVSVMYTSQVDFFHLLLQLTIHCSLN